MACASCAQRRQMIDEAVKRDGPVGVIKVAPAILAHLLNPDIRDRTVRKRPNGKR